MQEYEEELPELPEEDLSFQEEEIPTSKETEKKLREDLSNQRRELELLRKSLPGSVPSSNHPDFPKYQSLENKMCELKKKIADTQDQLMNLLRDINQDESTE